MECSTATRLSLSPRGRGDKIVFNGCFDILHAGHVGYLDQARGLGDRLVVAVNNDASAERLKGNGRSVNDVESRMRVLDGLASVDWVTSFSEDTPEALLSALRPDCWRKAATMPKSKWSAETSCAVTAVRSRS